MEAGADVLFVEAIRSQEEIDAVIRNVDVPLLYNFVEKGKSPLIPIRSWNGWIQDSYIPRQRHVHGGQGDR